MAIKYYGQYIAADTESEILLITGKAGDVAYATDTKMRYAFNGTAWLPNSVVQVLRSTVTLNGKATGSTLIYTVPPTSFRFVPVGAHVEAIAATGTGILSPSVSVGTNSTAYNNIFTSTLLSSLLASAGLVQPSALSIANAVTPLTNGAQIFANVNAAATGYTTYTFQVDILGYYKV